MPIQFCVIGTNNRGEIVERWFVRNWYTLDVARADMDLNPAITRVTVVNLCRACGYIRVSGRCLNEACATRQVWLEAAAHV